MTGQEELDVAISAPKVNGPSVEFSDLRYAFPVRKHKKGQKAEVSTLEALKTLTAKFQAGKLTAIMGPSRSGKTTLLNILAGRASKSSIKGSELTGEVSLDGRVIDPVNERTQFAYVMSEDSLFPTLTPRESLMYAARLRLPHITQAERTDRVNRLLSALKISNCADTLVGDERMKGISSGERKRTAMGVELVHDPSLVLLDEPTSGLDSYTAYELVENLRSISNQGRTVVITIHQPRSEIFDLFHDVVFLSLGSIVYQGPAKGVRDYFAKAGYPVPEKHNPADFVMHLIQTLPKEEIDRIVALRDTAATKADIGESRRLAAVVPPPVYEVHRADLGTQPRVDFLVGAWKGMRGRALLVARQLRRSGATVDVMMEEGMRTAKIFQKADKLGADKVAFVAPDEFANGLVRIKDLRSGDKDSRVQKDVPVADLINWKSYFEN